MGVVALAAVLRLVRLTGQSVWYDEAFSLVLSSRPLDVLLSGTANDYHPPLSYMLLGGLLRLVALFTGHSVENLDPALGVLVGRLLSAVAGTAAVYALYQLGRSIFNASTGVLAAGILALSPFQILYAQEVRMYSIEVLLGIWALHSFYYAYRFGALRHWALYTVCGALLLYNLYFSVFLLFALGLFFSVGWLRAFVAVQFIEGLPPERDPKEAALLAAIIARRVPQHPAWGADEWRRGAVRRLWWQCGLWLSAHLLMLLAYAPWLTVLFSNVARVGKNGYWIPRPNALESFRLADVFLFNATNLTTIPDIAPNRSFLEIVGLIVAVIYIILVLNRVLRWLLRRSERRRAKARPVSLELALAAWLVPVSVIFFISYLVVPLYLERSLIYCAPPFYLLCARVLERVRQPIMALVGLIAGLAVLLPTLWLYYAEPRVQHYQLESVNSYIAAQAQPGDIVLHTNKLSYLPFVYLRASSPQYVVPEQPGNPHDDLTPGTQNAIGLHFTALPDIVAQAGGKRIWLVVTQTFTTDYHLATVKAELDTARPLLDQQVNRWVGEDVYLYGLR